MGKQLRLIFPGDKHTFFLNVAVPEVEPTKHRDAVSATLPMFSSEVKENNI
jgi:hypothetical protein